MKIGIVVGSVREGRVARNVGDWLMQQTEGRTDATYEVIDLKEFNVPMLADAALPMMANKQYASPEVQAWSDAIDACDGYIFILSEHNHAVAGAFKNAFDTLSNEWRQKAVSFVTYATEGGARVAEHMRQVVANFSMYDVRAAMALMRWTEFDGDGAFVPKDSRAAEFASLLDELVPASKAMATLR